MYELDATIKKSGKMWLKKDIKNLEPINNPLSKYVKALKNYPRFISNWYSR